MDSKEIINIVKDRKTSILGSENFRHYGILIPLIEKNDELHVVFEVRSMNLRSQPGEICFPGGRVDREDVDAKAAAIRETSEELGISTEYIKDVYPLDYMIQAIEGRTIYPFVGLIDKKAIVLPNPDEVQEIFTVPLEFLLTTEVTNYTIDFQVIPEQSFPYHLIPGGKNYPWKTRRIIEPFYFYKDYVIWGLTANILKHFIDVIKK